MKELCNVALDTAKNLGATYADIRIINFRTEDIQVRNGKAGGFEQSESLGAGIRVIANGAWGFACTGKLTQEEIVRTTTLAVEIARASAILKKEDIQLTKEKTYVDFWQTPFVIDPFAVSKDEKLDLLFRIDAILRKHKSIKEAFSSMSFRREHQHFANSEGSFIEQILLRSGGGYSATAVGNGDTQTRSFPASFRGQYCSMGYELIKSLPLIENAERIRSEAVALLKAPLCPSGKKDLILGGAQLVLQIHESVGHPTELDRVLGMEESFAGRSFLTTEKYGSNYKFGSAIVNIVADGTVPGGLATFGYDDDGVRAQRWHLVQNGIFSGYQTNRELALKVAEGTSRGCCRADGFARIPMIRNNNISLMPGTWELDDLIKDTKDGIYMDVNKSWSIDQMRLNFQFGCEIGWEIKNGKKTRMVKYPNYQGITPEFWASCDAICNDKYWVLWGVPSCGKGEPVQTAEMSHGCSPTRFRQVTVGVR
ncbi:MAG: TldD/PmbA family protein [Planctomycetota bacterium]|nr:TldD/PmbA family protein [Planctomycetota bacterium]MDI6786825.1 TldD/PmbA family protein [Planctomycetota bacterium]